LDEIVTTVPPLGAGPLSVTVPVVVEPPITDEGDSATPIRPAGRIVSEPTWLTPFSVPVMFATVVVATPIVEIEKLADVDPLPTVTVG
jgi:hypothetical protein